jgi:hypothetical protein
MVNIFRYILMPYFCKLHTQTEGTYCKALHGVALPERRQSNMASLFVQVGLSADEKSHRTLHEMGNEKFFGTMSTVIRNVKTLHCTQNITNGTELTFVLDN